MYGTLTITLTVAAPSAATLDNAIPRKEITLIREACEEHEADERFAAFLRYNPAIGGALISARWQATARYLSRPETI